MRPRSPLGRAWLLLGVFLLSTPGLKADHRIVTAEPERITRARRYYRDMLAAEGWVRLPPGVVVTIEKAQRTLELKAGWKVLYRCKVGLGPEPVGDKFREGDLRTPEGEYFVCSRNVQSRFHLFAGISYPGPKDARRGVESGRISARLGREIEETAAKKVRPPWKTPLGGEIGIHGNGSSSDWTLGCIAVDDEDIERLWFFLQIGTKVVIRP